MREAGSASSPGVEAGSKSGSCVAAAALALLLAPHAALRADNAPAPELTATRVEAAPVLDGSVLDDPAWSAAQPATSFWQTTPDEGQPASERTEARVVYTPDTLYFGVVCYDREPDKIIVSESRRDSPLDETDSFQIVLDTFHDRQNGFVFGTNPSGIEYDGQVVNEGQGGDRAARQQTGAGAGFNINWDAAWAVRTRVGEFGWSAEFAIPFRTLRYPRGGAQVWGLNFQRNIRRRNETAFWAPLPRQFSIHRVSVAGSLRGIEAGGQRNLKLTPYALGEAVRRGGRSRTDWDADVGIDLKYGVTSSFTLDLTLNTDFAQVEVDEQQINLDRFNLFFPEKRPFFLENAGQFTVGSPGEVDLFFSRRIGIGPNGEVVPLLAGGRLSGKLAGATLGLVNMQTRALGSVAPANNFGVARVARDLPSRSGVGVIFLNRESTGRLAPAGGYNRTLGADAHWGFGRYGQLSGFVARTFSPRSASGEYAFQLSAVRDAPAWELSAKYMEVGEGFNPELGFLRRSGFRKPELLVFHRYRPRRFLGLLEIRPHVSYRGFWKPDGFQESGFFHVDSHWEWKSGHELHTGINFTREGLRSPFEIHPGVVVPPGTYDHREAQIVTRTNQGAPVSFDGSFILGGFFGGHRASLRPSMKIRVGEAFNTDVRWEHNDIDLPGGSFAANLVRVRLSYSFSPRLFVQALVQHNDRAAVWSNNLRLGWLQTANTGLFVVYNENRDTSGSGGLRDRSLIVKFSRLVDALD